MTACLVGLAVWVATAICCAAAPWNGGSQAAYLRSGDLATHCALKGELRNQSVTLHIFMRLAPGASSNTLKAAGYAMLYSEGSDTRSMLHLEQGDVVEYVPDGVFLRSPYTQQRYNLTMVRPRERFYIEVFALWGNWTLHESDKPHNDFELRIDGFKWFCTAMPPPAHFSPHLKDLGALSRPWPPPQEPAVEWSSCTATTKVWVLLSTFHESNPARFAALLEHHFSWHKQLGVHGYILYVQGWLAKLLAEPIIQAFISKGLLYVVLFDDMDRLEHQPLQPHLTRYTHQVLIDNHALLALWNTDSLLVNIDLDEFVITPQPTTIAQMYAGASHGAPGVAALVVMRGGMLCKDNASAACCVPNEACLWRWLTKSSADVESGRTPHPLTCLALATTRPTSAFWVPKLIVDPNQARATCIHWITASMPGSSGKNAEESTVRVAHVVNMYSLRYSQQEPTMPMKEGVKNWFWPADQLQGRNQTSPG